MPVFISKILKDKIPMMSDILVDLVISPMFMKFEWPKEVYILPKVATFCRKHEQCGRENDGSLKMSTP